MKNIFKTTLIVVVAVLLLGSSVQAQLDASEDVNVYAEILDTITIDPNNQGVQDMDFSFGTSPQGGNAEITLGTDGSLSVISDAGTDVFWNNTGTPAVVNVGGTASRAFVVEIGNMEVTPSQSTAAGTPTINLVNSANEMLTVDRFLVEGTNVIGNSFSFDNDGLDTLTIGAVLTVPDGISIGDYEGEFTLTVSYE